uniref:Uncharacterized protein n=1 Tax=Timema bartmani TaxID=61472 RepID=A0A7R9HYU4_9NEOP|nr:unnamed protein product [Timema bartmani]
MRETPDQTARVGGYAGDKKCKSSFDDSNSDELGPHPASSNRTLGLLVDPWGNRSPSRARTAFGKTDSPPGLVSVRGSVCRRIRCELATNQFIADVRPCLCPQEDCQNYIRILVRSGPGKLLVCGTNSFKPICRDYAVQSGSSFGAAGVERDPVTHRKYTRGQAINHNGRMIGSCSHKAAASVSEKVSIALRSHVSCSPTPAAKSPVDARNYSATMGIPLQGLCLSRSSNTGWTTTRYQELQYRVDQKSIPVAPIQGRPQLDTRSFNTEWTISQYQELQYRLDHNSIPGAPISGVDQNSISPPRKDSVRSSENVVEAACAVDAWSSKSVIAVNHQSLIISCHSLERKATNPATFNCLEELAIANRALATLWCAWAHPTGQDRTRVRTPMPVVFRNIVNVSTSDLNLHIALEKSALVISSPRHPPSLLPGPLHTFIFSEPPMTISPLYSASIKIFFLLARLATTLAHVFPRQWEAPFSLIGQGQAAVEDKRLLKFRLSASLDL